jgi:hypothetical protein
MLLSPSTPENSGWHHITMVADPSASGASIAVTVDGSPFQPASYSPRASTGTPYIVVLVGPIAYHTGAARTPRYDFHIDNVTIDFP